MAEKDSVCINISHIEKQLHYHEKVSLVFLLYDDDHVALALEYLDIVNQGADKKLLEEWSTFNRNVNWRDYLIEALSLTQCFDILRDMGYTKQKLENITSVIHPTKKRLFSICEQLNREDTLKFVKYVKNILLSQSFKFSEYGEEYLELYFLHWLQIKFITLNNIQNLESALKAINDKNKYYMDSNNAGICLIINQKDFYNEGNRDLKRFLPTVKLENRKGTDIDKERLVVTFKQFGFDIIVEENRDHKELVDLITEVTKNKFEERHCCLIICVLSHGIEGSIYGNNSIPVNVCHIQNIMCDPSCINLQGKPKLLLLQSCQGTKMLEAIETDGVTPNCDLLVFWSTVPGYASFRNKMEGTWFIQSLCQQLVLHYETRHFEEIATRVINDVSEKKIYVTSEEKCTMLPYKHSTLRKELYLSNKTI